MRSMVGMSVYPVERDFVWGMKAAPFGAFGAMAYTIGYYGPEALGSLVGLILLFYVTAGLFVVLVLGAIARLVGFSIFRYLAYIKDELLIVLGTSSSESALPQLMESSSGWAARSRWSASSCRPVIRSTSTAPTST